MARKREYVWHPRHGELCDLRGEGLSMAEIARRMGVSKTHVYRIDTPRIATWAAHDRRLGISSSTPRATYVYRLVVTRPDGSDAPGWEPENWWAICEDRGWAAEDEDGHTNFHWPTRVKFLSGAAAGRRAKMLREYGATVVVERSEPVEWSGA